MQGKRGIVEDNAQGFGWVTVLKQHSFNITNIEIRRNGTIFGWGELRVLVIMEFWVSNRVIQQGGERKSDPNVSFDIITLMIIIKALDVDEIIQEHMKTD